MKKKTYAAWLSLIVSPDPDIPDHVKYKNNGDVYCEENPDPECNSFEEMPDREKNLNEEKVEVGYQKPGEQGRRAVIGIVVLFDRCEQEYQGAKKDDYLE